MDVTFDSVFYEIAVLVLLAAVLGFVGIVLRQPLVVAFITAGVLGGCLRGRMRWGLSHRPGSSKR
jgi:Kef-type K+ transport system membrane component KefB